MTKALISPDRLKFALHCAFYTLIGIYYDLWQALIIIVVNGLMGSATSTDLTRIVSIVLIWIMGALPAVILIGKLKTWLFSLPMQYILYFGALAIADFLNLSELWKTDVSLYYHLQVPLMLLIHQIPGVVIGLCIRHLLQKVNAHKQLSSVK